MVMAGSGILFVLFVLMHMYGNLKAFAGAESFNTYAHHLRTLGEPILPYEGFLWIFRLVMLGALVVHVASAASLWRRANGARSSRYVVKKAKAAVGRHHAARLHHLPSAAVHDEHDPRQR
jgi:succinate dehydrogenase / fumarate reductase cytochrome b subunit